jgi:hypothetical protein
MEGFEEKSMTRTVNMFGFFLISIPPGWEGEREERGMRRNKDKKE